MAAKKKSQKKKRDFAPSDDGDAPRWVGVLKEHMSSELKGFAEGMEGRIESLEQRMNERFDRVEGRLDRVEGELELVNDAVRTHSKEIHELRRRVG